MPSRPPRGIDAASPANDLYIVLFFVHSFILFFLLPYFRSGSLVAENKLKTVPAAVNKKGLVPLLPAHLILYASAASSLFFFLSCSLSLRNRFRLNCFCVARPLYSASTSSSFVGDIFIIRYQRR